MTVEDDSAPQIIDRHLSVHLPSTTLSGWSAGVLIAVTVISSLTLLVAVIGALAFAVPAFNRLSGEVRMLQINVEDVQNRMILNKDATRADFAPRVRAKDREGE